jgi:SOS-response transcriptional repressor LexA
VKAITDRQRDVLREIQSYINVNGFPPTISYIGTAMNISSARGVTAHLDALERKGYLKRTVGTARGLKLTPEGVNAVRDKLNRQSVVITIEFDEPMGSPWSLTDIADAVQKDYFNYAGATATAEIKGAVG